MAKSNSKMIPIAVFDISSGSIGGAHALIPKEKTDEPNVSILASTRVFSEPKTDIKIEQYVSEALASLDSTIVTLQKADNHKPKDIHVFLSSPWFLSQSRTIVYSKTEAFVCSQKLIDSLIEKEIAFMMQHDMGRFGSMGKEAVIIEKQISRIILNGYSTNKPFGKKTQSLEISLMISVSPRVIVRSIMKHINKSYYGSKIRFNTNQYALFITTRDFLKAPAESLIMDVGEETTDVSYIKNGLFIYQQSFPVGFYEVYRQLESSNHATLGETRALIETFRLGKLSDKMTGNLQKNLESFGEKWIKGLQESMSGSANLIKIPSTIYVSSLHPFAYYFSTYITKDPLIIHSAGSDTISPITINTETLSKYLTSLDPEKIDDAIAVGVLFASRFM